MACGVGSFLSRRTTIRSLERARADYYARERLAHVFASLSRAREYVADHLRAIPGVERVQTRVVADVTLDLPGMVEAAVGRLVSIPERGRPEVNDLRLRSGRMPDPAEDDEILASETFVLAHGFELGTKIRAVIHGRREELEIVGTALAPEFIYAVAPGLIFLDDFRFGIFWMRREALGPAFEMKGAFNDVSLRIRPRASLDLDLDLDEVIARVDDILDPYGGLGAIPREDQHSAFFVDNEIEQLRSFGTLVPTLFLGVAAFLLNIVVGRIVAGQREEIAAIKALGYRDRELGIHYARLVGCVVIAGTLAGSALGAWLGSAWTLLSQRLVRRFPRTPDPGRRVFDPAAKHLACARASLDRRPAVTRLYRRPGARERNPGNPRRKRRCVRPDRRPSVPSHPRDTRT